MNLPNWNFYLRLPLSVCVNSYLPVSQLQPHLRGRQFPTLESWKSPGKFAGNCITQINVYVYIYMRLLFRSARLGWRRPPSRKNSSIPKKTRIPVGQPIRIQGRDRPRWRHPFEGGRYCCRLSQGWLRGQRRWGRDGGGQSIDPSIHRSFDRSIDPSIDPSIHTSIIQLIYP